jgi:biopolymer transport protein ExbD
VPIVTLIDILAILLIFFIVTTTFKTEETLVKVNLPTSSELGADVSAGTRQVLSLSKDGSVSLGQKRISMEQLPIALQQFRRKNPNGRLELKADEEAPLGLMVKVWDAANQAGLKIGDLPLRILLEE